LNAKLLAVGTFFTLIRGEERDSNKEAIKFVNKTAEFLNKNKNPFFSPIE